MSSEHAPRSGRNPAGRALAGNPADPARTAAQIETPHPHRQSIGPALACGAERPQKVGEGTERLFFRHRVAVDPHRSRSHAPEILTTSFGPARLGCHLGSPGDRHRNRTGGGLPWSDWNGKCRGFLPRAPFAGRQASCGVHRFDGSFREFGYASGASGRQRCRMLTYRDPLSALRSFGRDGGCDPGRPLERVGQSDALPEPVPLSSIRLGDGL